MADLEAKLINKAIVGSTLGLVGFLVGEGINCVNDGASNIGECILNKTVGSITEDATNLWKNYTPVGLVYNQVAKNTIEKYEYKSVIGTIPDFKCKPNQQGHQGFCYDNSQIPNGYSFASLGRYTTNCPSGYRDDGTTCWRDLSVKGRGTGYAWEFGDTPFSLEDAKRRCERVNGTYNCEKYGAIYYPQCEHLYGQDYHNSGCCLCQRDIKTITKNTKWITPNALSPYCPNNTETHDGLCYINPGSGWEYSSPGVYRKLKNLSNEPDKPNDKSYLPEVLGISGLLLGVYIG